MDAEKIRLAMQRLALLDAAPNAEQAVVGAGARIMSG